MALGQFKLLFDAVESLGGFRLFECTKWEFMGGKSTYFNVVLTEKLKGKTN